MAAGGSFFADAASAGNAGAGFDLQPLGDPLIPVSCGGAGAFGGEGGASLGAMWDPFEEGMDSVLAGAGEMSGGAGDYSWDFGEMEQ